MCCSTYGGTSNYGCYSYGGRKPCADVIIAKQDYGSYRKPCGQTVLYKDNNCCQGPSCETLILQDDCVRPKVCGAYAVPINYDCCGYPYSC